MCPARFPAPAHCRHVPSSARHRQEEFSKSLQSAWALCRRKLCKSPRRTCPPGSATLPGQSGYKTPSGRGRKKPFAVAWGAGWLQKQPSKTEIGLFTAASGDRGARASTRADAKTIRDAFPASPQPAREGQRGREDGDSVHEAHEQREFASGLPMGTRHLATSATEGRRRAGECGPRLGWAASEGTRSPRVRWEATRAAEPAVAMTTVDFLITPAKRRAKAPGSKGRAAPLQGGFRAVSGCHTTPSAPTPPPAEQVVPFRASRVCPMVAISVPWQTSLLGLCWLVSAKCPSSPSTYIYFSRLQGYLKMQLFSQQRNWF